MAGGKQKRKKKMRVKTKKNTTGGTVDELMRYGSGDGTIQRAPPRGVRSTAHLPFLRLAWLVCMIARMLMPCSKKFLEA